MGIPFSDPCFVYGDKKLVLYNIILHKSTLKKKSNYIDYHAVREVVAPGEWLTGYELTDTNVSDLLKNIVPGGSSKTCLFRGLMYYIILDWLWFFTPWDFTAQMKRFIFFYDSAVGINR